MDLIVPITDNPGAIPTNETRFRFFSLLPPEIRREIYILATPPRVVRVQEVGYDTEEWHDKFEDFKETCRTTLIQFRLHPDLTYFVHNWAPQIASKLLSHNQTLLEAYGFTSTKDRYQPWVPTDETPEIPSIWLADHPDAAWAMTRSTSLFSSAPIPPFLHVCSESREMLKSYGYELAFGTRTDEPHTWFHFGRDTLYVGHGSSQVENVLVGDGWDVSLFRPIDLQRVKRLALRGGYGDIKGPVHWTSGMLRLVPNLDDLFMLVWDPDNRGWDEDNNEVTNSRDHYVCVSIDELDFIPSLSPFGDYLDVHYLYRQIKTFKYQNRPGSDLSQYSSFDNAINWFRESLYNDRRKPTSNIRGGPPHEWNVPRVHLAHVCSLEEAEHIFSKRRQFWDQINMTKNRLARGRISKRRAEKAQSREAPEYMDIGEAFLRANVPDEDELRQFFIADYANSWKRGDFTLPVSTEEFWWLTEAVVLPPRFDIL